MAAHFLGVGSRYLRARNGSCFHSRPSLRNDFHHYSWLLMMILLAVGEQGRASSEQYAWIEGGASAEASGGYGIGPSPRAGRSCRQADEGWDAAGTCGMWIQAAQAELGDCLPRICELSLIPVHVTGMRDLGGCAP